MKLVNLKAAAVVATCLAVFGAGCGSVDEGGSDGDLGTDSTTLGVSPSGDNAGIDSTGVKGAHRAAAIDGEVLYRGMMFGVGPAAQLFPELWTHPKVIAALKNATSDISREDAADRTIFVIKSKDPTFFARFGADIQSHNHPDIASMLDEAKIRTQEAVASFRGEAGMPWGNEATAKEAAGWFYRNEVVAADLYVAAVVAAVVFILATQIDVTPITAEQEASQLRADAWINLLAEKDFTLS